jgi:hypothetical protein
MMDYGLSDAEERAVFGYDEDACPVCEDLEECECDYIGTRLAAALCRADDLRKQMKEEGEWPWWK